MNKWKVTAWIFIVLTIIFGYGFFWALGTAQSLDEKVENNIKVCAIRCWDNDYLESYIDSRDLICYCSSPYYEDMATSGYFDLGLESKAKVPAKFVSSE
jgi:hypothetical protein